MQGHLAVCYVSYDASASLVFDGLSGRAKANIRFCDLRHMSRDDALAGAAAVLIVRGLHHPLVRSLAAVCAERGVPYYLYCDDNFWVLADEFAEYRWLHSPEGQATAREAAGVVVTSQPLADFVAGNLINARVLRFAPVIDRGLLPGPKAGVRSPVRNTVNVAFAGAPQRNRWFEQLVVPTLVGLARAGTHVKATLRAGAPVAAIGLAGVSFDLLPVTEDFPKFVRLWRLQGPDVLVHPPVESANAKYKTSAIVLIAYLLGAIPVVADEEAFRGLSDQDGVIVVTQQSSAAWDAAIRSAVANHRLLYKRLAAVCSRAFAPELNEATIAAMLSGRAPDVA